MRLTVLRHKLRRLHVIGFPIEIKNLIVRPEKIFRMPVAFQAPRHAVRFGMINYRLAINGAVTTKTTDPAIDVRRMIEKNVIGRAMQLLPLDRVSAFPTRPHRLELWIVLLHLAVAV